MKPILFCLLACTLITFQSLARETNDQHLLDGTSMNYYYQNGTGVHVEFDDGFFNFLWILGPNKDATGKVKYRSRKIGDKLYMVNFFEESDVTFVTIVFNFNQNVLFTSALIAGVSDNRFVLFEGGIIEDLSLSEK